ncbi:uncharacterized protein LY89DRAFT_673370 [Mollisia scopiformis]|uniref:Uncharacterized protein n=1 Tax=Mollisia scopiformis TaxID=149040 RepID=A0A194WWN1_MOLSC|nr:uncharacterized protein LY89DRAFT_673370 [Mollisia scopiformis]KUJ12386.1 hypothetical protein LY89DRAFT_673370 [Mollisia scopiformis]
MSLKTDVKGAPLLHEYSGTHFERLAVFMAYHDVLPPLEKSQMDPQVFVAIVAEHHSSRAHRLPLMRKLRIVQALCKLCVNGHLSAESSLRKYCSDVTTAAILSREYIAKFPQAFSPPGANLPVPPPLLPPPQDPGSSWTSAAQILGVKSTPRPHQDHTKRHFTSRRVGGMFFRLCVSAKPRTAQRTWYRLCTARRTQSVVCRNRSATHSIGLAQGGIGKGRWIFETRRPVSQRRKEQASPQAYYTQNSWDPSLLSPPPPSTTYHDSRNDTRRCRVAWAFYNLKVFQLLRWIFVNIVNIIGKLGGSAVETLLYEDLLGFVEKIKEARKQQRLRT